MSSKAINPFDVKSVAPKRVPRASFASLEYPKDPSRISAGELKRFLYAKNKNHDAPADLEEKFKSYLTDGESYGHLQDETIGSLFNVFTRRKLAQNDLDFITRIISENSVLTSHFNQDSDSHKLARTLLDYARQSVTRQEKGINIQENPLPIQDLEGDSNFIKILTDSKKGLTLDSALLRQLKNGSPIERAVYDLARHMGFEQALISTRKSLSESRSTPYTKRLDIGPLLIAEDERLAEILPSDGGFVVARLGSGRVIKIPPINLTDEQLKLMGDDKRFFAEYKSLNFGDFFQKAKSLAISGEDEELRVHVANGISLIVASYNLRINDPSLINQRQQLQEEFKLLKKNLQGDGLLPYNLARIIREKVTESVLSKDFVNRSCAGHLNSFTKKAVESFMEQISSPALTSLPSIRELTNANELEILYADGRATKHPILWIQDEQISNTDEYEANKNLVNRRPISLETAVRAYQNQIQDTLGDIESDLHPVLNPVNLELGKISFERQRLDERILATHYFNSIPEISSFISESFSAIVKNRINSSADTIQKALTKFASNLLKYDSGKFQLSSETEVLRKRIFAISQNIVNGDNPKTSVQDFVTELKRIHRGDEHTFRAIFNDIKGKDELKLLINSCIIEPQKSYHIVDDLNLDYVESVFKGTEGQELLEKLESFATPGSRGQSIIDNSGHSAYGALANLVFSKDRDTDKVIPKDRLTALMYLVYSAAQDESHLFRLSRHVVEKLRTSSIGNSDQLVTQFIRATKLLNQGTTLEKFKRVLVMKDREYLLDDGYRLKRRELENLKIVPSSLAIKNFGDEKTYEEYKTALKTIKETYDRLATNPDLSFQAFIQELPENEKARDIFMHLFSGLDGRVVLNTSTEGKPEDTIILSLVEHVERLLGSHYLVGFARSNSSKGLAA